MNPNEDLPPDDIEETSGWRSERRKPGFFGMIARLILISIIGSMVIIPFTPVASKVKKALLQIAATASQGKIVERSKEIIREVPRDREVIKKVVERVVEQAPPPPLPEKYIARKEIDVATLYNGLTINTLLQTEQGNYASLERDNADAFKVQFQVQIRIPKANQSITELARISPSLPDILPGLHSMVGSSKVSGFYHKLYENKTALVQRDLTRLNKILDRHNFFDCETILEMTHPQSKRKALLIQSEMDVVADGSDGDRLAVMEDTISTSSYYQPSTSYEWAKRTKTPNPLLARWENRLATAKEEYAKKGLSAERNRTLKATIDQLTAEITGLKNRSSLIADSDPFIVLSLLFRPYVGTNSFTPQMGDMAVVIHDKKVYPAICGDYGPTMKMGEASLFMAKAINPKSTPYIRSESDLKVSYLIFPGTAKKPFGPPNLEEWRTQCLAYLSDIGGVGPGFEIHTWEDKFKKPEPPPVPVVPPTAEPTSPAPPAPTPPVSPTTPAAPATPPVTPANPPPAPNP